MTVLRASTSTPRLRSTVVPLLAFTMGVASQALTNGFSTDWARPD